MSHQKMSKFPVRVIHRILAHGASDILLKTRFEWIKCVEFLLTSRSKELREVFCSQIRFFVDDLILSSIFSGNADKSKEQKFLDTIKHAMTVADGPHILETLMECTAEIMVAVSIDSKLFLCSLILLVDQLDSTHVTVRMNASRLIHKSCYFHLKGGLELILSKDVHICNELYDYLSERLASRPVLVREFAEAVFGVEIKELSRKWFLFSQSLWCLSIIIVKKLTPFVLPKRKDRKHSRSIITMSHFNNFLN